MLPVVPVLVPKNFSKKKFVLQFKPCLNYFAFLIYIARDILIFCNKFVISKANKSTTLQNSYFNKKFSTL